MRSVTSHDVLIVSWVTSQLDVISHPRVSLFLSHCGHNSALESMALGTPVLCSPFGETQSMMGVLMLNGRTTSTVLDYYSEDLAAETERGVRCVGRRLMCHA